jgi:hypothetical protein
LKIFQSVGPIQIQVKFARKQNNANRPV